MEKWLGSEGLQESGVKGSGGREGPPEASC